MKPLVSVLLPVYMTNPDFFSVSLKSIIEQDYENLEIVIAFDKSGNLEMDRKIQNVIEKKSADKRIKVFPKISSGLVDNLNHGLAFCKGEYIARMDSDDISSKKRIGIQMEYMQENNIDICGTWAYILVDDIIVGKTSPPFSQKNIRSNIMLHNPLLHASLLIKKSVFEQIGQYNKNFSGAEDYEFYTRAIWRGISIANVPQYLVYLRETPGSIMHDSKTWKKTRKAYIKTKINAVKNYGMHGVKDIFYAALSPISYFIPPSLALKTKSSIGWYSEVSPFSVVPD